MLDVNDFDQLKIGLATAERLGADGARVVLTARGEKAGREVEASLRAAASAASRHTSRRSTVSSG